MLSLTLLCLVWTLNHRHCGRLKHIMTKWIQTHKSVLMGLHIISCIVSTRTSRPNVSRRCFERIVSVASRTNGTDFSVSSRYRHSNVSISSRSRHSEVSVSSESRDTDDSVSSWSRHHMCHLQPCFVAFVGLRAIAVWPIDFIQQLRLCMSKWRWISRLSKITVYKYWKKQNFHSLHCGTL